MPDPGPAENKVQGLMGALADAVDEAKAAGAARRRQTQVAVAIWEASRDTHYKSARWDQLTDYDRRFYRALADAAIEATGIQRILEEVVDLRALVAALSALAAEEQPVTTAERDRRDSEQLAAEIERGPIFTEYPAVVDLDFAIEVALEQVEEWSHAQDPHGWCHQRPILLTLLQAALAGRSTRPAGVGE